MTATRGPKHGKGTGEGGGNSKPKRLSLTIKSWDTIIAAVIGAAATIVATVIAVLATNGNGASSSPSPSAAASSSPSPSAAEGKPGISDTPSAPGTSGSPSVQGSPTDTPPPASPGETGSQGGVSVPSSSLIRAATRGNVSDLSQLPDPRGEKYTLNDLKCGTADGSLSPRLGTWTLSSRAYNYSAAYPGVAGGPQFFYCPFGHSWTGTLDVTQGIDYAAGPNPPLFIGASILAYEGNKLVRWDMGIAGGALKHYEIKMTNVTGFFLDTNTCANGCLPRSDNFVWGSISMYPS